MPDYQSLLLTAGEITSMAMRASEEEWRRLSQLPTLTATNCKMMVALADYRATLERIIKE